MFSRPLGILLAASFGLRVILVLCGGQDYGSDEGLYYCSEWFLHHLVNAELEGILDFLLTPTNTGFILIGCVPTIIHTFILVVFGMETDPLSFQETAWISALILSMASVACIGLIYAVARRSGADRREALIAAFLMGSSNSIFYYSRHLLPYDSAMALALLALWIGLRPGSMKRACICGFLTGLAFLTYNGYWIICLTVLMVLALRGEGSVRKTIIRTIVLLSSFLALPVFLTATSIFAGRMPYVVALKRFAGTVTQGEFAEGWSLPWAYLWHAEHGLLLVWLAGLMFVIWKSAIGFEPVCKRGLLWLTSAVSIYILLLLGSIVFQKFVVYGRSVRQLIPFLCLITAWGMAQLNKERWFRERQWLLLMVGLVTQSAFNFSGPLTQKFPRDIRRWVSSAYDSVSQELTVQGPPLITDLKSRPQASRYIMLNAQYLYPIEGIKKTPPGKVLFRTSHPLEFLPCQYEGYTPIERSIIRTTDISIRLIDTHAADLY